MHMWHAYFYYNTHLRYYIETTSPLDVAVNLENHSLQEDNNIIFFALYMLK